MGDLGGFLEIWEFSCLLRSLSPVQSFPAFSTAPCRGAHPHFGLWGALLSSNRGVPELVPRWKGGRGAALASSNVLGECPGSDFTTRVYVQ